MKRQVLIYGLVGGALIIILKLTKCRLLVIDHSIESYGALTAATFAALGIWLGLKLTKTRGACPGIGHRLSSLATDHPPALSEVEGPLATHLTFPQLFG